MQLGTPGLPVGYGSTVILGQKDQSAREEKISRSWPEISR